MVSPVVRREFDRVDREINSLRLSIASTRTMIDQIYESMPRADRARYFCAHCDEHVPFGVYNEHVKKCLTAKIDNRPK